MTQIRLSRARARIWAAAAICTFGLASAAGAQSSGTLGFVVRDWYNAIYETKFMDECPEGLNVANDEYWWRSLSREDRAKKTDNGIIQTLSRYNEAVHRGPNREDVCLNPTALPPDGPFKTAEGKFSYGANLDGTTDGRATAKTCAHPKYTGLDGAPAVDNQMYRLLGCTYGWRSDGIVDLNANEMRGTSGLGMILIEVTGVNERDPRNSDDVTVTFYRSIDQFTLDSTGRPLPFSTYRIETVNGKPRYADALKGSIKDGVLTTGRGDVRLPFYGNYNFMHPVIKDMGLRLEIDPDGRIAKGQITGYYDVENLIYYITGLGGTVSISGFSCSSINAAAHLLADGYPDPKTGRCTMLSSAFNITAYSAFVLHPEREEKMSQR